MNSISISHYLHPTSLTFNESGLLFAVPPLEMFIFLLQCLVLLKKQRVFSFRMQFIVTAGSYSLEFVIAENRRR